MMKNCLRYIPLLIALLYVCRPGTAQAQGCAVTFSYTNGPNGSVTFTAAATPTNVLYTWSFGNSQAPLTQTVDTTSTTYSANGAYLVTLTIMTTTGPSCTATFTQNVVVSNAPPICSLTIAFTPPNPANACNGTATVIPSAGLCGPPSYTWSNGSNSAVTAGLCQGQTYNVLVASGPSSIVSCCAFLMGAVTIPSCSMALTSAISYSANGFALFSGGGTGTLTTSTFSWSFGDGTTGTGSVCPHTYSANGTYTATLTVINSPTCFSTIAMPVFINSVPCNLNAGIGYSITPATGAATLFSTSTGTIAGATFSWNIGGTIVPSSSLSLVTHTFLSSGNVTVALTVKNNATCLDSATNTINVPCITPAAALAHTVGLNGQVSFSSTSLGTNAGTNYIWQFGDGVYTSGIAPQHTYINAGVYMVQLKVKNDTLCQDSLTQAVNVTGIGCYANPNFTLTPTATPQYWNATPAYPWNVTAASWDWGDGSVSNTLYASHIYSAAAAYNICLSVTVSCGSTGSVCTSYSVYRTQEQSQDMSLIYVNVMKPGLVTGLSTVDAEPVQFIIYPNPNNGAFSIRAAGMREGPVRISVYNLVGQMVHMNNVQSNGGLLEQDVEIYDLTEGIYIVKLYDGHNAVLKKIIITKP